jgi:murein DD-endopeptidase MepM/ murein hydrolase activator NlpD
LSKLKTGIILVVTALFIFSSILPVFATQVGDIQNDLKEVKTDISERKKELQQNKTEQENVRREIAHLESEIKVIEAEIRSLANKITVIEGQIAETEEELVVAEENIDQMDEVLAVRLRAIHENGKVSYFDVLFSSTSFVDFLSRFNNLQYIISEDKVMLEEFKVEKERVVAIHEALEERRQELQTLRRENVLKRERSEKKRSEQQKLAAALQEAYDEVESAAKKLEAEAKSLDNEIKRIQAVAAAAAAAAAAKNGTPNNAYRGTGSMTWPVPEFGPGWVTSPFGNRIHPITGRSSFHGGVDIGIPHSRWPRSSSYSGSPAQVVAADSGIAYVYPSLGSYGNLVVVDHGGGISTAYAHLHGFLVGSQTPVVRGQAIGTVGSTGASTGPHLHFEVRVNGDRVNPMPYIR